VQALQQETSYHPFLACDGFVALKVVRENKPDLMLLDYQLSSMDGLELCDRLQESREAADIPTIMMSANLRLDEARKRKITCLTKPVALDDLLSTIDHDLIEPRGGSKVLHASEFPSRNVSWETSV
jgi:CheY-like chemotaxis protein